MNPRSGPIPTWKTDIDRLIGTWANPSFGTWTILPSDIIPIRPSLGTVPYFPELYGQCRRLFTLLSTLPGTESEGVKALGCYECKVGKEGKVHYGMPFEVTVKGDQMEIRGLSGAEEEGADELCPLIFVRKTEVEEKQIARDKLERRLLRMMV